MLTPFKPNFVLKPNFDAAIKLKQNDKKHHIGF